MIPPTWEIRRGDSLSELKKLPKATFDLIITSPPYNIGKEYEKPISVEEYVNWCQDWLNELHRVAKPSASFWLNLGYFRVPNQGHAVPISYLLWDKTAFYLMQEIVWHYGAGVAGKNFFSPRNEKWLWYVKDPSRYTFNLDAVRDPNVKYPNQKKNGKLRCNPLGKNPGDVWIIPKVTAGANRSSKERTSHPAQFPTAVIRRIIRACSNPGDTVLDPFMGSGSTAAAAYLEGRNSVGFEIREDYCRLARERLRVVAVEGDSEPAVGGGAVLTERGAPR